MRAAEPRALVRRARPLSLCELAPRDCPGDCPVSTLFVPAGSWAARSYNVYSSGSVFMSRPMLTKIPCLMNLHHFPFDVQDCYFSVGSWAYDGYELDIKPYPSADGAKYARRATRREPPRGIRQLTLPMSLVSPPPPRYVATMLDLYEANTEFALLKVTSSDYDTFYSCCPEPYPLIRFDLQFARYPLTYFSGIVLPLVLVTISGTRRLPSHSYAAGGRG